MVALCESLNGSNSSDSPHHCHTTAALDIGTPGARGARVPRLPRRREVLSEFQVTRGRSARNMLLSLSDDELQLVHEAVPFDALSSCVRCCKRMRTNCFLDCFLVFRSRAAPLLRVRGVS